MAHNPIFIGGLSHSGKTPLRVMLSAHPNLVFTRRTYLWPHYYNRYGDLHQPEQFERCLHDMLQNRHIRALQPDPERIRQAFQVGEPTYGRLFAILHEQYAACLGKPRWGDQTGFIEQYAEPIFAAYPDARIIHLVRDPRQRYASLQTAAATAPKVGYTTAEWLHSVNLATHNLQRFRGRYLLLHYETLHDDPEATLRQVCAFLDEPFTPALLTLPANGTEKLSLNAAANTFIQQYAGSIMIHLGYPLQPTPLSSRQRYTYTFFHHPYYRIQMSRYQPAPAF